MEQIANENEGRTIQVEIQDDNTSLIQDIDPAKEHLKVTTRDGNTYQVLTFDQDQSHAQEAPDTSQEKFEAPAP